MPGPLHEIKSEEKKGLRVTVWENASGRSYTVEKAFKRKGDTEWTRQKIALFPSELAVMAGLLTQACDYERRCEADTEAPAEKPERFSQQRVRSTDFRDEDIPF